MGNSVLTGKNSISKVVKALWFSRVQQVNSFLFSVMYLYMMCMYLTNIAWVPLWMKVLMERDFHISC